jgi:hypothetical protein
MISVKPYSVIFSIDVYGSSDTWLHEQDNELLEL